MSEHHEREYFTDCVKPLLGGDVEYLGEVGGPEKLRLVGEATCLLNPIHWPEPFGMVMIEALGCGTPVVATYAGAAPEIVEDGVTGFLAGDEGQLAVALTKVDQIDRWSCRRAAEQRFSGERMVAEHLSVYRRLAEAS
jgi:glycosyltransferase involved in cell wall biosynthesis